MIERDFLAVLIDLFRLAGPLAGLGLALLASWRFDFPAKGKFFWGFAALASIELLRLVVRSTVLRESFLVTRDSASDVPPMNWITGALSIAGLVLIVLALKSLLTTARMPLGPRRTTDERE